MIVLYSKDIALVVIEVANQQNFIVHRLPLECNTTSTTLHYSNLKSGTNYNISAVWTTEDSSICALGNTSTMACELPNIVNWINFNTIASAISINFGLIVGLMVGFH